MRSTFITVTWISGLTECRPCPTDCRPCPTTGTCDIDSCNDTSRHCTINKEIDPSFGALGIRVSLQKQPSAPSLEQLEEVYDYYCHGIETFLSMLLIFVRWIKI